MEDVQEAHDVERVEVGCPFEKVGVRGFSVGSLLDAAVLKLGNRLVEVQPADRWKNVTRDHQVETLVAAKDALLEMYLLELLQCSAAA